MSNVVSLEERLPHYVFNCGDKVHVVPVSNLDDLLSGRLDISGFDDGIIKAIIADWAVMLREQNEQ